MPYRIDPDDARCVQVQRDDGWERVDGGCHESSDDALAHLSALNMNVDEQHKIAQGDVAKLDDARQVVFGWAYFAQTADGDQVVDHSKEFVPDPQNLEDVAYDFVLKSREGDVMHDAAPVSVLIESVVLTKEKATAMGLPPDVVPAAAWWVGFKVNDADVWKRVVDGELAAFSIHGRGTTEEVEV